MDIFKYLKGTSGKFIIIGICIFIKLQLNTMYENVRGTIEGIMAQGQVSSDSTTYLWAKLMSDGSIMNMINFIFYIIIVWISFKIGQTIILNKIAILKMD